MSYQTKSINAEIKEVDVDKRMVAGYFSVFDVKDSDGDILKPGAFKRTIQQNGPDGKDRIMHLWQHNPTKPMAKPRTLKEDAHGLFFESKITDTTWGTDALKLYRDGVIKEHSIGFNTIQSDFSSEEDANVITEVKLWEGSTVTWGANEHAAGQLMKGQANSNALLERYKELVKAFDRGDYTDETFRILQKQIDHIEGIISKSIDSGSTTPQADSDCTTQAIADVFKQHKLEHEINQRFNGTR